MPLPEKDPATGRFLPAGVTTAALDDPDRKKADDAAATKAADDAKAAEKKASAPPTPGVNLFAKSFMSSRRATNDEIDAANKEGADVDAAAAAKKKADDDKAAADAAKGKGKAKTAAAPAKPAARPRYEGVEPPPITASEIAAATAEGFAKAMGREGMGHKQAEPARPAEPEPELDADQQEEVRVLSKMEELNPTKYKGLVQKYKTAYAKLLKYAEKWQADHPGEEFDDTAEEHKAFHQQNEPDWEDRDYRRAEVKLEVDEELAPIRKQTEEQKEAAKRQAELAAAEPVIGHLQGTVAKEYWKTMGEDFDIIKEDGSLDNDKAKALAASDPITFGIRVRTAERLDVEVAEIHKLYNGLATYDEKNVTHNALMQFYREKEGAMLRAPRADRLDTEGRQFLPAADYNKRLGVNKADTEDRYWTFSATDIAVLRANDLSTKAQKIIQAEEEKLKKFAEARGYKLNGEAGKATAESARAGNGTARTAKAKAQEEEAEPELDADGKPLSPGSGSETRLAAAAGKAGVNDQNPHNAFFRKFLG